MRCSNLLRIILCGAVMGICSQASAHFIFVVPDAAGEKVQVVMSEGLEPDLEMNSGMVRSSELQWKAADGKAQSLAPKSEGDETALVAAIPGKGNRVVFGKVDFGVMQRGASKAHWLVYFPKTIIGNPFDEKNTVDADRPVEIVPVGKSGETKLKLLVQGKPAANTELTVILPGGAEEKHTTDDAGLTKALPAAGRYGAWARNWKEQSGTAGDKKYEEVRNYATLVFDVPRADGSKVMVDTKLAAKTSTKKAHGNPHAKAHGNPHANPHAKGHAATGNNPHAKAHGNPHANPHKNPHGDDTATVGDSDDEGGFHTGQKKATAISDTVKPFATMPQAASSFGAAAMDGWLYVYGGHIVTPHEYHTGAVSGQFHRLDLSDSKTWEKLPDSTPLQGMNLVAHNGGIYRIGGMAPINAKGKETDNHSVKSCARYDVATKKWEPLPDLNVPRSSHDVVVLNDKLIVIGGWNMEGAEKGDTWLDTMEVLDLKEKNPAWKTTEQPFRRRALIAVARGNQVYVIGGFDEDDNPRKLVDVLDIKTNQWSKGPQLPGSPMNGFAPAACVHDGDVYVSVFDGSLHRLNAAGDAWDLVANATPRIVHRLAPIGSKVLMIGGASFTGNLDSIEGVTVSPKKVLPKPDSPKAAAPKSDKSDGHPAEAKAPVPKSAVSKQ